jgi:phage tail sheath protein FI
MPNYESAAPGVHIEEITPAGPIAGAGTSVPAFIGTVTKPPGDDELGRPRAFTDWTGFTEKFGAYQAGLNLPYAVRGFFENGGTYAYVVPVADTGGLDGALTELSRYPDVSMVCLPGVVNTGDQRKVLTHCEQLQDRFAVLDGDPDRDLGSGGPLRSQRAALTSDPGFGGLYWPWIQIPDPLAAPGSTDTVSVPPSGHVAGVMARSDGAVGVHKAPANEIVRGAIDLDFLLNDAEQGVLNKAGINAIRRFPGGPPRVWGARTLSDNIQWRYVNVRRLVSYIEDSIVEGVRWAVFAPNNTALWKGLERSISEFLTRVWQSGALFGVTAAKAFYVTISEELNPPDTRNRGEVVVEIGLAVTRPAEHIVVRIGLWDGGARITEG